MAMRRRDFIKAGAAAVAAGLSGCATTGGASGARVVVVGGGFGGATAAKYVRRLDPAIDVVLVEPHEAFVSCPLSNLVISGFRKIEDITVPYDGLARHGVRVVRDSATAIDVERKRVKLARGEELAFDRVIVAPGVDLMWDALPAMASEAAQERVLHAWKAGPQTVALRRQLEAMPDGGVFVIAIPEAPYRCPPGPYERACQVAAYFKAAKPRSKVLVLDANADVTSKGPLFKKVWAAQYGGIIEYRPSNKVVDVDWKGGKLKLDVHEDVRGDVLNVLPPMRAGHIADPFVNVNKRWVGIDWLTYESTAAKGVHVVGDALQLAPLMPKSGHMANAQGKACAAAVVALLQGKPPSAAPMLSNACYSWVDDKQVIHVTSIHKYDTKDRTMKVVPGASGVSVEHNAEEAEFALNWARNIWADSLA
ncbi:MAG TPA: NAD(P)/FAD-dependent oxidoreductase [Usitatibacter sp.]|nr:NAD(P)/FAD-dependent oxidoreductase [Usitatibacter sp.]